MTYNPDDPPAIAEIIKTCEACPSQWEGRLRDGCPFYIRYRWGYLAVHIGPPGSSVDDAIDAPEWFGAQIGPRLDGHISLDEVLHRSGLAMDD